ncbi:MAG: tetratricopeptide repeat protein, partial [Nitrospinota bacterium]
HMYIPLTYTVWTALAALSLKNTSAGHTELNPLFFHTANLLLHILSVCIVFFLLRLLLSYVETESEVEKTRERQGVASFFGALLFAIHPLQVEAVSWVTGMKDLLSGTLVLFALWQYILWSDRSKKTSWNRSVYLVAGSVSYIFALLGKPTAVVVPLLAFILDYFLVNRSFRGAVYRLFGWVFISLLFVYIAKSSQSYSNEALGIPPFWQRPFVFLDSISFYLFKFLLPTGLGVDYGRTPSVALTSLNIFFTASVPIICAVMLFLQKNRRVWLLSAGVSVVGILPASGLIPFGFQFFSSVADRYFYVSMLGASLALAFLWYLNKSRAITACLLLGFLFLGAQTLYQSGRWRNSEQLFGQALKVNHNSYVAHNNFGSALVKKGKIKEAIVHFQEAVRINPEFYQAYNNLGGAFFMAGNIPLAIENVERVLAINPSFEKARMNLAKVLYQQGRLGEARHHFEEVLRTSPSSIIARYTLAETLFALGEYERAEKEAERIIELDSSFVKAYTLIASLLVDLGKLGEARSILTAGERMNPGSIEIRRSLEMLEKKSVHK